VRIGIFGGTFDPIHYGHLRAAEEARESFGLQKILFLPSARPPHKRGRVVSSSHHRLEMVRRAVAGNPNFHVSDLECNRPGLSYSVETLHALRGEVGPLADLYFLLGADAFLEIQTWRSCPELFELSHWVVMGRPGARSRGRMALPVFLRGAFSYDRPRDCYTHPSGHTLCFRKFRCLEISGTEIRDLARAGRSLRYLVPPAVEDYVWEHRLYGEAQRDEKGEQ
jgi:nicotinate-nucleotide adenylyltransferase